MTTAMPQHARSGALARGRRTFRRWRRSRPFWGGLFTVLSGAVIFGTTQMSLGGLTFKMGPTGFLTWLIPTILVACGLLMWFTPAQRLFYAIVAAVTAVYSLIGVNLGGFFIGLLLGILGAALGFAWTPIRQPIDDTAELAPVVDPGPGHDDSHPDRYDESYGGPDPDPYAEDNPRRPGESTVDELLTGPMTDVLPPPYNPLRPDAPQAYQHEAADPAARPDDPPPGYGGPLPRRSPRVLGIIVVATTLGAAALFSLQRAPSAYAEPCPANPKPPAASASPSGKPLPKPTPTPTPTATPTAEPPADGGTEDPVGDFFSGIVDGVKDIFGIGDDETAAPAAEPTPTPSPTRPAKKKAAKKPVEGAPVADPKAAPVQPPAECDKDGKPIAGPVKRAPAVAGQPDVAKTPSRLTGSRVTMFGLSFDGVVDLPTVDGTIRVLKFSMDRSVTDDFELRAPGPDGRVMSFKTNALTVEGNVLFYATRFHGTLLGIPLTFTPESPPPLTLPIMIFGDPDISLVFVDCDKLTARPSLDLSVV